MLIERPEAERRPALFACSDAAPRGAPTGTGDRDGSAGLSRRQLRRRRAAERRATASGTEQVPSSAVPGLQCGTVPVQLPAEAGLGNSTVRGKVSVLRPGESCLREQISQDHGR